MTTGVRNKTGEELQFSAYQAQLVGAGETSWVENVGSIPERLADIHESVGADGFSYWARFTDTDGKLWEVEYNAETRTTEWRKV